MIKFSFLSLMIFFSSQMFAAPESLQNFCSDSDKGWNTDDCIASCSSLLVDGAYTNSLADGAVGFCYGQATTFKEWIYKMELGSSTDTSARCTIFEGTLVIDSGTATPGQTIGSGDISFSSCKDGTVYDLFYYVSGQIVEYAGETNFPDGSGSVAKTSSYCATDPGPTMNSNLTWLDVMSGGSYSDASLCHVRQTVYWNSSYVKAAATPTTTDYNGSSTATTQWDMWKDIILNSLVNEGSGYVDIDTAQTDSEGFYKEYDTDIGDFSSTVMAKPYESLSSGKIINKLYTAGSTSEVDIFGGQPFDKSATHEVEISIFAKDRNSSDQNEFGLRFFFLRDGTAAKFIGTNTADTGIYTTFRQVK